MHTTSTCQLSVVCCSSWAVVGFCLMEAATPTFRLLLLIISVFIEVEKKSKNHHLDQLFLIKLGLKMNHYMKWKKLLISCVCPAPPPVDHWCQRHPSPSVGFAYRQNVCQPVCVGVCERARAMNLVMEKQLDRVNITLDLGRAATL